MWRSTVNVSLCCIFNLVCTHRLITCLSVSVCVCVCRILSRKRGGAGRDRRRSQRHQEIGESFCCRHAVDGLDLFIFSLTNRKQLKLFLTSVKNTSQSLKCNELLFNLLLHTLNITKPIKLLIIQM